MCIYAILHHLGLYVICFALCLYVVCEVALSLYHVCQYVMYSWYVSASIPPRHFLCLYPCLVKQVILMHHIWGGMWLITRAQGAYRAWDASCQAAEGPSCPPWQPLVGQIQWPALAGEDDAGTWATEPATPPTGQRETERERAKTRRSNEILKSYSRSTG